MEIHRISRGRFLHTVGWGLLGSLIVVGIAAGLGRASINIEAALTDKPDIAIYLLLPDEGIQTFDVLKEEDDERHYMAETKDGPKFIILKKGESEWFVSHIENLHAEPNPEEPEVETE
jgi:3-dehydroquinate synthase class II